MWHIISRFNESTLLKYAGDMMVQQMKYNSGYDVAGEEDPTNRVFINTETTYRTGKFFFRNLATGARIRFDIPNYGGIEYDNDKVITYPANLLAADVPVFADTPVELKGKTFNVVNNTLTNIVNANIGAAAGILYSKLNLSNSIVNADINASAGIVDSKLAQITNKAKLPGSTVYNDQANAYGSFNQTFIKGFLRLDDLATHFTTFTNGVQTGNFSIAVPTLAANDTMATLGLTNTFNTWQKIQYSAANALVLYRPDNVGGNGTGIAFNAQNSTPAETTYAAIYGFISLNTAGVENGGITLQVKSGGTLAERAYLTSSGVFAFGGTNKVLLDPTGLTTARTYTFQNASGKLPLLEFANIFTEAQTIQKAAPDLLSIYRTSQTANDSMGITLDAQSSTGLKRTYAAIYGNMVAVTNAAENGQLLFQTIAGGVLSTAMALNHNANLLIGRNMRLGFTESGLTAQRIFTHPDIAGEVTVNEAPQILLSKILTAPVINGGAGAGLNGSFITNAFTLNRTAVGAGAEVIQTWQVSDDGSSYLQINNATANDLQFSPRISSFNALESNNAAVGLYMYSSIAVTSDAADSSNAVTVLDSRRADSTPIVNRRLFQFRNAGANVFEIYPSRFDFTNKTLVNAIINIDESVIKHGITNAEGDLYFYDAALSKMSRLPRGTNGDVLKSTAGGIAWAANIIAIADLNDIGNVNTTGAANGNILQFNGTDWVHSTIGTNGEANTGANAGTGAGVFRDKTAAQLNFRSIHAGNTNNLSVTQNTDDITIDLGTTITLPSATNSMMSFTKPASVGAERLVRWTVDDDPNGSEITLENMTASAGVFAPALFFTQYSSNAISSGNLIAQVADANDIVNETGAFQINARRPAGALVNRPLLEITNYDTKKYLFYPDRLDLKGNEIRNSVITIDNIVKNIGSPAYLVFTDGVNWYARNTKTGIITSTNTSLTVVLQAAINALTPGRTNKETVKVNGAGSIAKITAPSYTSLDLRDAKLTLIALTQDHMIVNSDTTNGNTQIDVIGGYFDGNNDGGQGTVGTGDEDLKNIIHLQNVTDSFVIYNYITDTVCRGVRLLNSSNCVVAYNNINDTGAEGIQTKGGHSNKLLYNDLRNTRYSWITTYLTPNTIIHGNYCDTVVHDATSGINISSLRTIVSENRLYNNGNSTISMSEATSTYECSGSRIINNYVHGSRFGGGIIGVTYPFKDVVIAGNEVYNCALAGIRISGQHDGVVIAHNIVHDNNNTGINVGGTVSTANDPRRMLITGNVCYNNGKGLGTDVERCGITIFGTDAGGIFDTIVTNNICYDTQGVKTQRWGIRAVNTDNCVIINNMVRGNLTDGMLLTTNTNLTHYNNKGYSADNIVATLTETQTFANKTLTAPVINGATLSGTFTLPSGTTPITLSKPQGGLEVFLDMVIDDATGSRIRFANATSGAGIFAPQVAFRNLGTNAGLLAGNFLGEIIDTADTGTVGVFRIDGRIGSPAGAALVNRPMFDVANFGLQRVAFYNAKMTLGVEGGTPQHVDIEIANTTTGTKIGTATTQKIGFHGAVPTAQNVFIASPTADLNSLKTAVDAIRTWMINKGWMAAA